MLRLGAAAKLHYWWSQRLPARDRPRTLERDSDPSNDNEFEAIAIGSQYSAGGEPTRCRPFRYRDGRWTLDEQAMDEPCMAQPT